SHLHVRGILVLPRLNELAHRGRLGDQVSGPGTPVDANLQPHSSARTRRESEPSIGSAGAAENEQERPIQMTEAGGEGLFVHAGRVYRCTRMGVAPDAAELLRREAAIDTAVEKVGHRVIQKPNTEKAGLLWHGHEIINVEWLAARRDT